LPATIIKTNKVNSQEDKGDEVWKK